MVLSEGDTINVDGVDYTIDANGNALAADGTIFRTAAIPSVLLSNTIGLPFSSLKSEPKRVCNCSRTLGLEPF